MPLIYHLLPAAEAEGVLQRREYKAASLETQGFIHASCSVDQALRVANRLFAGHDTLAVLCIDRARVEAPVRDEEAGDPEAFPHIFGPLNTDAIVEVRELQPDDGGRFAAWDPSGRG